MNIIFFGSSKFAVPSLEALVKAGHQIRCVVTQPDKKKGRGMHVAATPVKLASQEAGINIYQPPKINTPEAVEFLKSLEADIFVVVAYGQILSEEILSLPKIISINAHASLLPKYRGAAPINWALIRGEEKTGVTIIKLVKEMDAGPILLKKELMISDSDDELTLEEKLEELGALVLIEALEAIQANNFRLTEQDKSQVSFAPKIKKEDGLIDWNAPAFQIRNLIRGCAGWPGAYTYLNNKLLKLFLAQVLPSETGNYSGNEPGEVLNASKEGILVKAGSGFLLIKELQVEGSPRMRAADFILGHRLNPGEKLVSKH